jgi:hypothetical protein
MPAPSSSRIPIADKALSHELQPTQQRPKRLVLRGRAELMSGRAVPETPFDRGSVGKIVTLSGGKFGAITPRDERGKRRPIRTCESIAEAQLILTAWRHGRDSIVAFVAWLANFLPRKPHAARVLGVGMSGVRKKPGGER